MRRGLILMVLIAVLGSACSTHNIRGKADASIAARGFPQPQHNGSFLPGGAFHLSPTYAISYVDIIMIAGVVGLVYQVVDPQAPAWAILETRMPNREVRYELRMQSVHMGGEGEARQVLARRAAELAREEGMTGYEIKSYSESIDSRIFLPRRTAEAVVLMKYEEVTRVPVQMPPPPEPKPAGSAAARPE